MKRLTDRLDSIEAMLRTQVVQQNEVLTFSEACTYLRCAASSLYKKTYTRQIPHSCPGGKRLYFRKSDLDNWINSNRRRSKEEIQACASSYTIKAKNYETNI